MIPVNMDLSHQNLLFESETGQWIHKMQQQNSYQFVLFLFCLQQVWCGLCRAVLLDDTRQH